MSKEIWRAIPNYEGIYEVSNLGRVKSIEREIVDKNNRIMNRKEIILKQCTDKKGYKRVKLFADGKTLNTRVHRLVALAFIPNPENLPQVNHKDEIKSNNLVENLEWCSAQYNTMYGTRLERRKRTFERKRARYENIL